MSSFDLDALLRENIKKLIPYSSARDEFKGSASVWLDANENSYGSPLERNYNRYPDPLQLKLKNKLSQIKGVPPENTFLGNGSDEAIDILIRAFCEPGRDNILLLPPTYGMYEVAANINDVAIKTAALTTDFQLDLNLIAEEIDKHTKIIFVCSPNNPTGNSIRRSDVETLLVNFTGLVVVDEAYINYAGQHSFIRELLEYPNLVVFQTLSKAWGLAALRIGMAFASQSIIEVFNRIKPPYNIGEASQELALMALEQVETTKYRIRETVAERNKLAKILPDFPFIRRVYPSDANFLLVETTDPTGIYQHLVNGGAIVRDRSKIAGCEGCLRITIGTPDENQLLINLLTSYGTQ